MITRVILDNDIEYGSNKCIICGRNFSASSSRVKYCGQCHIEAQCQTCGNWKKISIYTKNFNNCKKCNAISNAKRNQQPGICTKCGSYSENRNISGLCENCKKDYYTKHNKYINFI